MKCEMKGSWKEAKMLINDEMSECNKVFRDNDIEFGEFTDINTGESPYAFTCKFKGAKVNKLETLQSKIRDAYPEMTASDVKLLIMYLGVKKLVEDKTELAKTYSSAQEFVRTELANFYALEGKTDKWDCEDEIPASYVPYLSGLPRPWTMEHIKGAMAQELDKYNRSLGKGMGHAKISKDTFETGFDMALSEYYYAFDKGIRERLAYDGSDPRETIGFIIDTLKISGDRELQIAKIWQYCINVKRVLYPEKGFKRKWHVCPVFFGKPGMGKTETVNHFFIKPLSGRGTATRFQDLADTRWTRAFSKYYAGLMDDIGYDDFTPAKEGVIKQMITGETKLDRALGGNKDASFSNIYLSINLVASSNYRIADLTHEPAMLRRLVELPSTKKSKKEMTEILHLDPNMIYRSIDENNLGIDPLVMGDVGDKWETDMAQTKQQYWVFRGLRQLGYLPQTIESSYNLQNTVKVELNELMIELTAFHRSEYGISPRGRISIENKLEEIGILCKVSDTGVKSTMLLNPRSDKSYSLPIIADKNLIKYLDNVEDNRNNPVNIDWVE